MQFVRKYEFKCIIRLVGGMQMNELKKGIKGYALDNGIHLSDKQIRKLSKKLEKSIGKSAKELVRKYRIEHEGYKPKWWEFWK